MIKFSQEEINYICQQNFILLNDLRNIKFKQGKYRNYLITVVNKQKKNIKYILKNLVEINVNQKVNDITSNTMYYLCGMNILVDAKYNKKKLNKYKFSNIYMSVCKKILNKLDVYL